MSEHHRLRIAVFVFGSEFIERLGRTKCPIGTFPVHYTGDC